MVYILKKSNYFSSIKFVGYGRCTSKVNKRKYKTKRSSSKVRNLKK